MRKLIRIAVVVVTLAAIALVAPGPASADHHNGTPDLPGDPHEVIPLPAVVRPVVPCVVTGELLPGDAAQSQNHVIPPAGNAASHSHYSFAETNITCEDNGEQPVRAGGGNDGHLVDLDGDCDPGEIPLVHCTPGRSGFHHPHGPGGGVGHENHGSVDQASHHGSTNESGWSHSSLYSGPGGPFDHAANPGGHYELDNESNDCDNPDANLNKGDIQVLDGSRGFSDGWVKYIRVGTVIAVWGCFYDGPLAVVGGGLNPLFSAELTLFPPAVFRNTPPFGLPDCLLPPVDNPTHDPPFPEPIGDDPIIDEQDGCGFSIAGVAERGSSWACDYAHPDEVPQSPCRDLP